MKSQRCFEFSGDEPFFGGHFPGMPILPGVVQVQLARELAEEAFGCGPVLKAVRKMKFAHMIRPGDRVELVIEDAGGGGVAYVFMKGGMQCSSGVLSY